MAKNQPIIRNNTYLTNTICRVLMPSSLIHAFKEAAERCGAIEHHLIGAEEHRVCYTSFPVQKLIS